MIIKRLFLAVIDKEVAVIYALFQSHRFLLNDKATRRQQCTQRAGLLLTAEKCQIFQEKKSEYTPQNPGEIICQILQIW